MKNWFKNKMLLLALSLVSYIGLNASAPVLQQTEESRADKIEALRIAFISQQLSLTPAEAEKFWPVYNQYKGDLETIRKNFKTNGQPLTAEQQIDLEQKKLDLKKKYKPLFEGAIGKDKVNQLYNLERKFQEKLKEIIERRQEMRENNMQGRARRNLQPR
jgi:hypothetical protein